MRLVPPSPICNDAEFSEDGTRRYWLSRHVAEHGPVGLFVGLNPSKAGADGVDDATVRKWIGFSRRWGWRGYWAANLFSYIETHSSKLKGMSYDAAVGQRDDQVLEALLGGVSQVVLCWGNNVPRKLRRRITEVVTLLGTVNPLATVRCFGLSVAGHPIHPLTLPYATPLVHYARAADARRPSRRDDE